MLKKTIVFTANSRPNYLSKMLDSLAKNDLTGWEILGFLEPDCPENIDVCKNSQLDIQILLNPYKMGVRDNPYSALKTAFDDLKSQIVIYLEDDIIISPDITKIALFWDAIKDKELLCISLCNYNSLTTDLDPHIFNLTKDFNALGLIISKYSWENHFKPQWYNDNHRFAPSHGWDWSINALLQDSNLYTLQPIFSRSTHIGREGGTHCTADFHDIKFGNLQICDYLGEIEYKIMGES